MNHIVLLGGDGYIGRNVIALWLERDPAAMFYVVSRHRKALPESDRVVHIVADATDAADVMAKLPEQVDYILDFVGRPASDPTRFKEINDMPAETMLRVAHEKNVRAMGFIGGTLGPASFVRGKERIAATLRASGIRTEVVAPTVVYGGGRADGMAKMIPLLRFLGLFSKKLRPIHIRDVADELVSKMMRQSDV